MSETRFEDYGQFGPDRLDLRVFDQDQVWVDQRGVPHALHEMTIEYRANVIAFLRRNAGYFRTMIARKYFIETLTAAAGLAPAPQVEDKPMDGLEWLMTTPLMRRLLAMTPNWTDHVHD